MMVLEKTFSNSFYLYLTNVANTLLGLIFFLIIAKVFSLSEMNLYSTFINTLLFLLVILDFGIYNYTWSKISRGEKAIFLPIFLYSLILLIFVAVSLFFNLFDFIFILTFSFAYLSQILRSIIYGKQEMKLVFITEALPYMSKVLLSIIFFNQISFELVKIFILINFMLSFFLKALSLKFIKFQIEKELKIPEISLLSSGYLLILLPAIYSNLSIVIVSSKFEVGSAIYLGFSVASLISFISSPFLSAIAPILASVKEVKVFKFFLNILLLLVFVPSIFLLIFVKDLINLVNPSYFVYLKEITLIIFSSIFLTISNIFQTFLFVNKMSRQIILIEVTSIAVLYLFLFTNPALAFLISSLIRLTYSSIFNIVFFSKKFFFISFLFIVFMIASLILFDFSIYVKIIFFVFSILTIYFIVKKIKLIDKKLLKSLGIPKQILRIILRIF